jgi:hypothetical protein
VRCLSAMSASASTQPKPMGDTDASIAADKPRVKLSTFCVAIGEAYTGFGDWVEAGVLRWVVAGVPGAEGTCNNRLIWERSVSACTSITAAVIVACCVLRASPARAHAPSPSTLSSTLLHLAHNATRERTRGPDSIQWPNRTPTSPHCHTPPTPGHSILKYLSERLCVGNTQLAEHDGAHPTCTLHPSAGTSSVYPLPRMGQRAENV